MAVKNKLIVLLEPDEAVRTAISSLLKQHGWQVDARAAANGLGTMLGNEHPVALVCESALPDITAGQVLKISQGSGIPVIFLGHKREIQEAVDLIHLGARDFLEKPFPQDRLLRMLNSLTEESPS
jgi:DNA-binding NtrC family response regulator